MLIELLYFDGCPGHARLLERLPAILDAAAVPDSVRLVEVHDEQEAARLRFLGSPSLRIDGSDVEPGAAQRLDYGLKCRLYETADGLAGAPSDPLILNALRSRRPAPHRSRRHRPTQRKARGIGAHAADRRPPEPTVVRAGLTPVDVARYLTRLGVAAPVAPTAAALGDLVRAHVRRVPFENLLIQLNRPAALGAEVAVDRIVRGGGGYCLELNGAFGALLTAVGFEVCEHEARVWRGKPDPPDAMVNHLALTVRCLNGSRWLAEVGMSDAIYQPIPLKPGRCSHGPFDYRLEAITGPPGPGWRFHHDPRGSFGGMDFHLLPARSEIISDAHRRLSTAPESPFVQLFSVGRRDLSGADLLRGRVLIRWDSTGLTQRHYDDAEEWFGLLVTDLGLPIDDLDTADREALWRRVCAAHSTWEASQLAHPVRH